MLISPDVYFKTMFEWLSLALTVCSTYSLRIAIFLSTDISQGSVATPLGCDRIFKYDFVTNFLQSLAVKEF